MLWTSSWPPSFAASTSAAVIRVSAAPTPPCAACARSPAATANWPRAPAESFCHRSAAELEALGRRHARVDFSLHDLRDRLAADWYEDEEFAAYNLTDDQITMLRSWALEWVTDLNTRLHNDDHFDD
ncbi:hypothetical protein ACFXPZ_13895 [Streptomyces sp. NPDC059101]|uniref:hypothetical protein n=1 Tax=Streptomyces sp. NPDC059101 TaxID=3346728 RepID=UPI0036ABC522